MILTLICCTCHTWMLSDFQPPCDIVFRKYASLKSPYCNISGPTHLRHPVSFPSVALQACFSSAEPLDCFRNTLCILFRHMPTAIRHLCIIDSCLIMQWMARYMSETVFNKQNPLYRVMIRIPQNKWYSCIKILSE